MSWYLLRWHFFSRKGEKMKYLIVVDMQNDFVDGALGSKEAVAILPAVLKKVKEFDGKVIFTRDTHGEDYLETQEGKYLPVPHCIKGTEGRELIPELRRMAEEKDALIFDKPVFGSTLLTEEMCRIYEAGDLESVTLIGLCTDICVISNALMLKSFMPELPIFCDPSCCAGVTPEKHEAALEVMRSCQIILE